MIIGIEVKNFGCFDSNYSLNLAPETFIVGPNNVGKSTFIAAYMLAKYGNFHATTRFRSHQEASFGHKGVGNIIVKLISDGPGGRAEITHRRMADGSGSREEKGSEEARRALDKWLDNTWYLSSDRVSILPNYVIDASPNPTLTYSAGNIHNFLLEKWTSRDLGWTEAEKWLKKIDPNMLLLKSRLSGNQISIETMRKYIDMEVDINMYYQGGGIQRALQIVSAVVFSPKDSVIIIEEPEMNLHKETQEILVDLFNKAVNEWNKQIIITTHSWDMILPIISDIGPGSKRGAYHAKADPSKFKLVSFSFQGSGIKIEDYDIAKKEFDQIKADFKLMWG